MELSDQKHLSQLKVLETEIDKEIKKIDQSRKKHKISEMALHPMSMFLSQREEEIHKYDQVGIEKPVYKKKIAQRMSIIQQKEAIFGESEEEKAEDEEHSSVEEELNCADSGEESAESNWIPRMKI